MGSDRRPGFTLIELIITLAILVIVLGMSYKILENCLRTEKWIERETMPEKIGEAIISLMRRDIEGAIYKNIGTDRVFQLIDNGDGEQARDELQIYTTVESMLVGDLDSSPELNQRSITAVSYYLKENSLGLYTLFRREATLFEGDPFLGGTGINLEIYDKVKSLSILAFDASQEDYQAGLGYGNSPWLPVWDSEQRLLEAQQDEEAAQADQAGIPLVGAPRVSDPARANAGESDQTDQGVLPPAAIPSAVRIEISILAGDEKGFFKDQNGNVMAPKVFAAIVPILASQKMALTQEDQTGLTSATGADDGASPTSPTQAGDDPSKRSTRSTK